MSEIINITGSIAYCPEAQAVISYSGGGDLFEPGLDPVFTQEGKVAPWGTDNDLPAHLLENIRKNDVVGANLQFNQLSGYGLGIKPMIRIAENGKVVGYEECADEEVLRFFEDNDIDGYFMEQINDMMTFFNVFPEIIVNPKGNRIVSLCHLEAAFSRWGAMEENDQEIRWHYYNQWEGGTVKGKLTRTPVLSRYFTYDRLKEAVARPNARRFVLQVGMPTAGHTYYSRPNWWSIFQSGWYDLSVLLPKFKTALIKNHLAVRYVVYISDSYWTEMARLRNISGNLEKEKAMRDEITKGLIDFLSDENTKGGTLISTRKFAPSGSGTLEDKYIQIESIESAIKGGEFIEDAEEASNIISYAMGVHPNLNGATPGKSKGSLGGSDKRELFMIKQAMMRPYRDRLLKPLSLIKRFNGWNKDIVFAVPDVEFPTLDVDKSGKRETNQNPK